MNTSPEIGQLMTTYDGLAVARVQMENIVVVDGPGDAESARKFINVQHGEHMVTFLLDANQCRHLARLLLGGGAVPEKVNETTSQAIGHSQPSSSCSRLTLVEQLMNEALDGPRPHSEAFRKGAESALKSLAYGAPSARSPYAPNTAEFDAFFAGKRRGKEIWEARLNALDESNRALFDQVQTLQARKAVADVGSEVH